MAEEDRLLHGQEYATASDDGTYEPRSVTSRVETYIDHRGERQEFIPESTIWYIQYVQQPNLDDNKFHKTFRRRFRMPYSEFQELLAQIQLCHQIFHHLVSYLTMS